MTTAYMSKEPVAFQSNFGFKLYSNTTVGVAFEHLRERMDALCTPTRLLLGTYAIEKPRERCAGALGGTDKSELVDCNMSTKALDAHINAPPICISEEDHEDNAKKQAAHSSK